MQRRAFLISRRVAVVGQGHIAAGLVHDAEIALEHASPGKVRVEPSLLRRNPDRRGGRTDDRNIAAGVRVAQPLEARVTHGHDDSQREQGEQRKGAVAQPTEGRGALCLPLLCLLGGERGSRGHRCGTALVLIPALLAPQKGQRQRVTARLIARVRLRG